MYDEQITSCKELGYPIVYIDESGFIKDALRTHGYQAKGSRCQGVHDRQVGQSRYVLIDFQRH
jgi:hypothetical protein